MPFQKSPEVCPLCNEGKNFKFIRDFQKEKNKFSLYQCLKCQIQFWLPLKIPKLSWYERNAFRIKNTINPEVYRGYHKKFLQKYKNFSKGTRALDLGCAAGEFIFELQKRGCEVWGTDIDKENIKIARERFGLKNVFTLSFGDFFQKKDLPKFDMIFLFAIIGYLENPSEFIKNVKNLLKAGGIIVVNAPTRERMLANMNHWDFPPHYFTRWNEESFSNLFLKHNFKMFSINYTDEFKTLQEAITGKFKTGLASKALIISHNRQNSLVFAKVVYFLGRLKDFIIGVGPAGFLWIVGKIFRYKNGEMLIEFTECQDE